MNSFRTLLCTCAFISMAAVQPAAASAFDGVYGGTTQRAAGSGAGCKPGGPVTVTVTEGSFRYAWQADRAAYVRIAGDGSYSAMLLGSFATADKHMTLLPRIDGVASGDALTGEYGTRWCKYTYRLDRSR